MFTRINYNFLPSFLPSFLYPSIRPSVGPCVGPSVVQSVRASVGASVGPSFRASGRSVGRPSARLFVRSNGADLQILVTIVRSLSLFDFANFFSAGIFHFSVGVCQ